MAQVQGRPVALLPTLRGSVHPFITRPSYVAIADLPFDERLAIMKKPQFRARILSEESGEGHLDRGTPLLRHTRTMPGLSDGGAHVGVICDAGPSPGRARRADRNQLGRR
jgi:hypothetical protein